VGAVGLAVGQQLADTQDRQQAARLRRGELAGHQHIVFAVQGAPLRMARR
jgi:dihydrodipicolinate reductase